MQDPKCSGNRLCLLRGGGTLGSAGGSEDKKVGGQVRYVMLNLIDCFCQNLLILCKMSGFPQHLLYGRLEDKRVGGYAVIGEQSSQSFLCPPLAGGPKSMISRMGLNNGKPEVNRSVGSITLPLNFPPLKGGDMERSSISGLKDEFHFCSGTLPKRTYRLIQSKPHPSPLLDNERGKNKFLPWLGKVRMGFKQSPLTLTLSRRGRGDDINSLKRTYSPIDLLTYPLKKKAAFTLSEVLITLGIIGVVAAITLPVIISKIDDRQNIARWKKAYSTVSNAFNLVVSEDILVCRTPVTSSKIDYWNGKCELGAGSSNKYGGDTFQYSEEFIDRFKEVLQPVSACYRYIDPLCDNNGYGSHIKFHWAGIFNGGTIYGTLKKPYTDKDDRPVEVYNLANIAFLLKDGSVVYLGGTHGGPWMSVDVNGAAQGPNQIGRDFFIMSIFYNKMLPLGADGTYNKDTNNGECECSKEAGAETMTYFAGAGGSGEVVSGGCCSAKYLLE